MGEKGMNFFNIFADLLKGFTTVATAAVGNWVFMSLWKVDPNLMFAVIVSLSIAAWSYRMLVENGVKAGRWLVPFAVLNGAVYIAFVATLAGVLFILSKIFKSEQGEFEARVFMFFLLRAHFPDQYPKNL